MKGKMVEILSIRGKDKKASSSIFFGANSASVGQFINVFTWP